MLCYGSGQQGVFYEKKKSLMHASPQNAHITMKNGEGKQALCPGKCQIIL